MQTGFATPKLARNLHQTLAAVDHHLHCLAFVLLRINRLLFLFCFHRVLSLSLSSPVRQIRCRSFSSSLPFPVTDPKLTFHPSSISPHIASTNLSLTLTHTHPPPV